MKRNICLGLFAAGIFVVLSSLAGAQGPGPQGPVGSQAALGTAFTYQGELRTASGPVSGTCDFQFSLWDALGDGAQVGSTQAVNGVIVVNGRFAVQLDFGSAFGGEARWLQIAARCPSGSGSYTTLAPRQPLTPAPYALSLRPGATISGTGSYPAYAPLALRNDAGYGLHVLSSGWDGVRVDSAGIHGVRVESAGESGVRIDSAGLRGLHVVSAGSSGVQVDSAHTGMRVNSATHGLAISSAETGMKVFSATFGVDIDSATYSGVNVDAAMTGVNVGSATTGLSVYSAGACGVYVGSAPTGLYVYSATTGLFVNSASNNGVLVGQADNGVHVTYADFNGYSVYSATRAGVYVFSAGQDGIQVCTNIPGSGCTTSGGHHGIELDNIDDDGVYVGQAGGNGLYVGSAPTGVSVASATTGLSVTQATANGVYVGSAITGIHVYSVTNGLMVDSASRNGVRVERASNAGVYVAEADAAGVWVWQAGEYGMGVYRAGNPTSQSMSTFPTGFEVEGSEGYGLYVGRADMDGVYVFSAGGDGVNVRQAGGDGMDATSTNASAYGGRFVNSAAGGAGLYTRAGSNTAPDLILGGNSSTNDNGLIRSDTAYTSSDILLTSNDAVQINLDSNNDESGDLWVVNGAGTTVFSINENGDMTAIGTKNALVTTQAYGQRKLYAMESPQNWFEDFGSAQLVNGQATVLIEPIFAQTVNLTETYHVFLTPLGDCALYVAAKTPTSFTVKAMGGQTCSIAFDYRIVAKRLGYEHLRLVPPATGGGMP